MGLCERMPWWVSVVLAVISYLAMHALASWPVPVPAATAGAFNATMVTAMVRSLAVTAEIFLPLTFMLGAVISVWHRHVRQRLYRDATGEHPAQAIDGMSWRTFEVLVGEGFRRQGYAVRELGGDGPDGGIDLVLKKNGSEFLVQCKHWRAQRVGVTVVRELYGVMSAKGSAGGMVVTSGSFTADAKVFARGCRIELIDGPQLIKLLNAGRAAPVDPQRKPNR